MIIRKIEKKAGQIHNCHEGQGSLWYTEMLGDYQKTSPGFKFIHNNVIDPGASIGEHAHHGDEEIYMILTGRGVMKIDGVDQEVSAGDVCLTRSGHSHSLTNSLESPMHFLVICTQI